MATHILASHTNFTPHKPPMGAEGEGGGKGNINILHTIFQKYSIFVVMHVTLF